MKRVSVYYPKLDNMGDRLNVNIIENIFGYKTVRRFPPTCKLSCIGSGLGLYCLTKNPFINLAERVAGQLFPTVYVWGTGFVRDAAIRPFYRRNMVFCALRGELSKAKVEAITGKKLGDITLCDGGILASDLFETPPERKYDIGIIPHFRQIGSEFVESIKGKHSNALVVDLREDPIKVIRDIASCDAVISSSLHGLIVADSFHIPNIHLNISHGMRGDGFKFRDYYSGFGMEHPFVVEGEDISIADIKRRYILSPEQIAQKKEQMTKAFPKL